MDAPKPNLNSMATADGFPRPHRVVKTVVTSRHQSASVEACTAEGLTEALAHTRGPLRPQSTLPEPDTGATAWHYCSEGIAPPPFRRRIWSQTNSSPG